MANERLRAAMAARHVSVATIASRTGVDPKTAQRWVGGRVPHARHRWEVAKLLGEREDYLWPEEEGTTQAGQPSMEILAGYAHRAEVPSQLWWEWFKKAERQVDLLGYALHFLPEQLPDLPALLAEQCAASCKIRIAVGDPNSEQVRARDTAEQLGGTLPSRIRATLRQFRPLWECDGAQIRYHTTPLYNSVFRFDDEMFVTPHLYGLHGSKAPLLHLRRLGPNGIFTTFANHFEATWQITTPAYDLAEMAAAVVTT